MVMSQQIRMFSEKKDANTSSTKEEAKATEEKKQEPKT
jgi:hypothetical protein